MDGPEGRRAPDRRRIKLTDEQSVRFWTRELGVTRSELADAVERAGVISTDVREYFAHRRDHPVGDPENDADPNGDRVDGNLKGIP